MSKKRKTDRRKGKRKNMYHRKKVYDAACDRAGVERSEGSIVARGEGLNFYERKKPAKKKKHFPLKRTKLQLAIIEEYLTKVGDMDEVFTVSPRQMAAMNSPRTGLLFPACQKRLSPPFICPEIYKPIYDMTKEDFEFCLKLVKGILESDLRDHYAQRNATKKK